MSKRRSCRRTIEEEIIHEKAVKIRKMTDKQLMQYIEDKVEKARSDKNLKMFLESLDAPGVIPGVGVATVDKIKKYAKEGGFLGL